MRRAFVQQPITWQEAAKMLNTTADDESVWSALSWEKRDVRSDALPMMNSFFWPLGECLGVRESFLKLLHLYHL